MILKNIEHMLKKHWIDMLTTCQWMFDYFAKKLYYTLDINHDNCSNIFQGIIFHTSSEHLFIPEPTEGKDINFANSTTSMILSDQRKMKILDLVYVIIIRDKVAGGYVAALIERNNKNTTKKIFKNCLTICFKEKAVAELILQRPFSIGKDVNRKNWEMFRSSLVER
ncbi:uncharacterized protein I206_102128 [Kwoniella pini CBS 10737]|uniref:Uncharacterized protein n=1 Tax=Kwoniella pini CBS 10737 TaxID=1296096 RepID=A0A1B9HUQ5_9TREE|nr:uncharacterized protein I206_06779 [Kwoniella pini CBS 10737]OCF47005.1 hypothetical protein I206_06779 [Kwoniella pini CBS 10737]